MKRVSFDLAPYLPSGCCCHFIDYTKTRHLLNELMMKSVCRLIANLVLSVSVITSQFSSAQPPDSVRYLDSDKIWPFSFEQQGEIKGIQPEVIRLLFQPFNIQVSERLVPDARLLFEVQNNNADVTIVFTYGGLGVDDYPDFIQVCEVPLLDLSVDALWLEGTQVGAREVEDLAEYRIGMLNPAPELREKAVINFPSLHTFNSVEALIKSLAAGRLDVVLMNTRHAQALADRLNIKPRIKRGLMLGHVKLHLAIARSWASPEFRARLCERVKELQRQEKFRGIMQSHFPSG